MKNYLCTIALCAIFLSPVIVKAQEEKKADITLDMLNCPVGVYKTYEDFVNKKPLPLLYYASGVMHVGGKVTVGEIVFKGSNGKVKFKPEEIWGFKEEDGNLNRMALFSTKQGNYTIPFTIKYIADFVYYEVRYNGVVGFYPTDWASADLNSSLKLLEDYTKENKTHYSEIGLSNENCNKKTENYPKYVKAMKSHPAYVEYNLYFDKYLDKCNKENPFIRFFLTIYEKKNRYEQGGKL